MDKEPTAAELWAVTATLVAVGLLLSRGKAWMPLLVWPVSLVCTLAVLGELLDPFVGPAILQEAGWAYVIQSLGSAVINAIAPPMIVGLAIWRRERSQAAVEN
jgi:hypothetical protein